MQMQSTQFNNYEEVKVGVDELGNYHLDDTDNLQNFIDLKFVSTNNIHRQTECSVFKTFK